MHLTSTQFLFVLVVALMSGCRVTDATNTVCSIANEPPDDTTDVVLQARLVSDRRHSTLLLDDTCPDSHLGLRFAINKKSETDTIKTQSFKSELRDPLDISLRNYDVVLRGQLIVQEGRVHNGRIGTFYVKDVIRYEKSSSN